MAANLDVTRSCDEAARATVHGKCDWDKRSGHTVGNQNGSFQRKYASPVPFGGRDGSFQRKLEDEDF